MVKSATPVQMCAALPEVSMPICDKAVAVNPELAGSFKVESVKSVRNAPIVLADAVETAFVTSAAVGWVEVKFGPENELNRWWATFALLLTRVPPPAPGQLAHVPTPAMMFWHVQIAPV